MFFTSKSKRIDLKMIMRFVFHIYIYIEMLIFLSIIKISIETYSIQMKGDKVKKNLWKIFRQIFKVT